MFSRVMIVYTPSTKRLENYQSIKDSFIPDLKLFPAIDSINKYDYYEKYGFDNNYHTQEYVNQYKQYRGKIGCNISHIELLTSFLNYEEEWLLVLEDDISLHNYNDHIFENLIEIANSNKSDYIHLYTNPRYIKDQKNQNKIHDNLYTMIPQWGTVAYLINKNGINTLLKSLPYARSIDLIISEHISQLNALCYINNIIETEGSINIADRSSKFGSLIWNL